MKDFMAVEANGYADIISDLLIPNYFTLLILISVEEQILSSDTMAWSSARFLAYRCCLWAEEAEPERLQRLPVRLLFYPLPSLMVRMGDSGSLTAVRFGAIVLFHLQGWRRR